MLRNWLQTDYTSHFHVITYNKHPLLFACWWYLVPCFLSPVIADAHLIRPGNAHRMRAMCANGCVQPHCTQHNINCIDALLLTVGADGATSSIMWASIHLRLYVELKFKASILACQVQRVALADSCSRACYGYGRLVEKCVKSLVVDTLMACHV